MSALDTLLATPPPPRRRPPPDEATMGKILAARAVGFSFKRIAEALGNDGSPTHAETVSRWVREHNEREG